jgi:hypothetical protein
VADIDALFERIDKDPDLDRLRLDIADAIATALIAMRASLGYWEKAHLADAIAELAHNVSRGASDTSWLRLCLVNLELAYVPKDKRSDDYTPRSKQLEALTFEDLMAHVRKLGAKV